MLAQEIIDVSRASAEQISLNLETADLSALVSSCCADYRYHPARGVRADISPLSSSG